MSGDGLVRHPYWSGDLPSAVFPLLTASLRLRQARCMTTRAPQTATRTTTCTRAPLEFVEVVEFDEHSARGRFNSAFFWVLGGYIDWHMHKNKDAAFADLPPTVVELGSGVGANMRYLPIGARLIAIEPNPYMHTRLRRSARSRA